MIYLFGSKIIKDMCKLKESGDIKLDYSDEQNKNTIFTGFHQMLSNNHYLKVINFKIM